MKVIRYMDLYKTKEDEEGNVYNEIFKKDLTIPFYIDSYNIGAISPYVGGNGVQFKNVSTFYYHDEIYKVIGNYNDLERLKNGRNTIKGYYNHGK